MADAPAPLSDLTRLTVQNAILTRDLAQARLDAIVKNLLVPGYDLLASGEYVQTAAKETP